MSARTRNVARTLNFSDQLLSHGMTLVVLAVLCLIGLSVRVWAISDRIQWTDECFSLLWLSGATLGGMDDASTQKGICTPDDIMDFQRPHGGIIVSVKAMLYDAPEQVPLHLVLCKLATFAIGEECWVPRLVSVFFGVLAIPLAYWLCRELEGSTEVSLVFALLVTISPFQVHLSQESRPYAMWLAMTYLSSSLLVFALKCPERYPWFLYSIAMTASFYTHILTIVVAFGHGIFTLLHEGADRRKNVERLALAWGLVAVLLLPWVYAVSRRWSLFQEKIDESSGGAKVTRHIRVWLESASYLVGDVMDHDGLPRDWQRDMAQRAIALFSAMLLVYGALRLARFGSRRARLFLFSSWLAVILMLVVPDMLLGGGRSASIRYLVPALGLGSLLITYALWSHPPVTFSRLWFYRVSLIAVCMLSFVSLCLQSGAKVTWNRRGSAPALAMAAAINKSSQPLLLYPRQGVVLLPVAHLLSDHVRILAFEQPPNTIPPDFDTYFYLSEAGPPPKAGGFAALRWHPAINFHGLQVTLWRAEVPSDKALLIKELNSGAK